MFGKFYKDRSNKATHDEVEYFDIWWSKDRAGHGGSAWKVFSRKDGKMVWIADADHEGSFIKDKHKGPTGLSIALSEFSGGQG